MSSWSIAGIMACKKINQLLNYDAREVLDWIKLTTLLNRTSSMTSSFSSTELVIRRCEPSKQVPDGNSKKRYGQSISLRKVQKLQGMDLHRTSALHHRNDKSELSERARRAGTVVIDTRTPFFRNYWYAKLCHHNLSLCYFESILIFLSR